MTGRRYHVLSGDTWNNSPLSTVPGVQSERTWFGEIGVEAAADKVMVAVAGEQVWMNCCTRAGAGGDAGVIKSTWTLCEFLISVPGLSRLVRDTDGVRRDITEGELSMTGEAGVSYSCTHRLREGSTRATGAVKRGNERSSSTEAARLPYTNKRITAGVDDTEVTTATDADAGEGQWDVPGWEDWVGPDRYSIPEHPRASERPAAGHDVYPGTSDT